MLAVKSHSWCSFASACRWAIAPYFPAALETGDDAANLSPRWNARRLANLIVAWRDTVFIKETFGKVFHLFGTVAEIWPPPLERGLCVDPDLKRVLRNWMWSTGHLRLPLACDTQRGSIDCLTETDEDETGSEDHPIALHHAPVSLWAMPS
jgi:hypothetical protein